MIINITMYTLFYMSIIKKAAIIKNDIIREVNELKLLYNKITI